MIRIRNPFLKLKKLIYLYISAKKIWLPPRKCDVLIFDSREFHPIENELLKILSHYGSIEKLVTPDNGEINFPVLLVSLLKVGKRGLAYYDSYVRMSNPKMVISYIDNSITFYSVGSRNPSVKFMFLQNGTRGYFADVFEFLDRKNHSESFKVDFMLVFGSHIGAEYAKHINGQCVPVGSFRNNQAPRVCPKIKGTLSFVSQYRDTSGLIMNGTFYTHHQFFKLADYIILSFLVEYAIENELQFRIIPCTGNSKVPSMLTKEKSYYREIIGLDCEFYEWKWHGSSYDAVDSSEVVVSIDSSLGLEAMARGTKSAIFSIRSAILGLREPPFMNFGWPGCYPDEGPFWTNNPNTASFKKILDHLFTISDEQWRAEIEQHGFQNVIQYDPDNSKLRAILARELG